MRAKLKEFGFAEAAIKAAWPAWWSDDALDSASARAELRFGVARRLGLDSRTLFEDGEEPRFVWVDEARFKHLATEDETELAGITSFARSVSTALVSTTLARPTDLRGVSAGSIRESILESGQPHVSLIDLISLCWGVAIPVAHLRVFPWPQKRMAAMASTVGDRPTVLLAKDASYPAPIAFYLAHELGHIALSHVENDSAVIDLDDGDLLEPDDTEEAEADAFALELLTGMPQPTVLPDAAGAAPSARGLADAALEAAGRLRIEPGTLALCYGYSTQDWAVANGALRAIYDAPRPVWQVVNGIAAAQLQIETANNEASDFLAAVLEISATEASA